jgi:hypothetical protein
MITAKLIKKFDKENFIYKGESKQKMSFLIQTIEDYPREIFATAYSKSIEVMDRIEIGDTCEWELSIKSTYSEKNLHYYTDVSLKFVKK